eukprot:1259299-Pleurochrysis_carterae.AAC.2
MMTFSHAPPSLAPFKLQKRTAPIRARTSESTSCGRSPSSEPIASASACISCSISSGISSYSHDPAQLAPPNSSSMAALSLTATSASELAAERGLRETEGGDRLRMLSEHDAGSLRRQHFDEPVETIEADEARRAVPL